MDSREQRGLALAALYRIDRSNDGKWLVPSQTGNGTRYEVDPNPEHPSCNCPDHRDRGVKCKHMFAVEFTQTRETNAADGTETVTRTFKVTEKVTYKQVWPAYNKAQTNEKRLFQELLSDLCRGVPDPSVGVKKAGQQPYCLADRLFSIVFKVFSTVSTRRFTCDMQDAFTKGHVRKAPHYNSICRFLEDPELTPILKSLIVQSSLPLRSVESAFAVDSTGFSTCRSIRWFDIKYGERREEREWVKVHAMIGVKTNVITAVEILDKHAADSTRLPGLLATTRAGFDIKELSADAAYLSHENVDAIVLSGAAPFIFPKENTTGKTGGLFEKMFHFYKYRQDEFLKHYHLRSNIESTFSMLKAKMGDAIRSKSDVAMVNEALCKVLAHNLCCLIQSMFELGVEPEFWVPTEDEQVIEAESACEENADIEAMAWV